MRQALTILGLLIALAGGAIAQRNQAEVDLQAAIRTETVDGELQNAIRQYREIVSKHKSQRGIAATALVRMAECYQKLGDRRQRPRPTNRSSATFPIRRNTPLWRARASVARNGGRPKDKSR